MSNLPATQLPEAVTKALMMGDLSGLRPEDKLSYYRHVCESVGLNPLTKPFEYIKLNGKEVLYAGKNCAEQLRDVKSVSVNIVAREKIDSLYIVTARAKLPNGREDESMAAVDLGTLKGDALANAIMKCETKAKRRVTLSICGLGMLDETEVEIIPQQARQQVRIAPVPHGALPPPITTPKAPELDVEKMETLLTTIQNAADGEDWKTLAEHSITTPCSHVGKTVKELCENEPDWVRVSITKRSQRFHAHDIIALKSYMEAMYPQELHTEEVRVAEE